MGGGYNIKILEITIDNCHKCDIETTNDPNNSQHFWINRRDLEIESNRNWQAIFDKCKGSSRQKYRKELKPNITFQPNKIFARNDLFEEIIKSCKATNLEFLKLKEKLGLCLYEAICDEQELISMSEEIFKEEKILSSVKWSDPVHFLKAQGKFIFSCPCTLFLHIFDT